MEKTGRPRNAAKAFTVIELLTVIGIIMVLAGILVPVLIGARANARIRLAETMMKTISVALDRYYQDLGTYPPDTGDFGGKFATDGCQDGVGLKDKYTLYRHLCGEDGQGIVNPMTNRRHGPYMIFKDSQLIIDENLLPVERIVVDSWGMPWVYEEHRSHTLQRDYDPANHLAHHPSRYDLYSVGPDQQLEPDTHDMVDNDNDGLVDEHGEGQGDDDITNW